MKPTHRYDTKTYHDYYIHQAGKGYPVFAGRRYQRGHGLGSRPSNGTLRMTFRIKMSLVHPNSCECTKSELNLFEVPPTQTSVAYGYWEQKGLTSALKDQGPYEFAVSGAGDDYIDLANTYPFVEAQIMDDDDTALDGGANVGSVNLWMHSLFSDVSVSLNENLVSPLTSLYPYRAYIEYYSAMAQLPKNLN